MERTLHSLHSKEKISNRAALLARLQRPGGRIELTDIQFQLNENLLTIIQQAPVEGIEVIEASDEDYQYEHINAAISPGFHCSYLRFRNRSTSTVAALQVPRFSATAYLKRVLISGMRSLTRGRNSRRSNSRARHSLPN
ncbi:hypothetical protein MTO98_23720 [Mucilaginibacter sp. SMC90]|uniref:hypothetical protein n=1 Tax=Mucilaginibacter sp. SMC90 TaxID=2929803 RepID=UPI001FB26EEE|nr:hypothetical protein [Mucilaginibacter sp. SMC90]UOE47419.1 hypothetical protein MTO98_23720 [Mucilaginibacter sp. SMC90]